MNFMGRFQASLNIRYHESPWQGLLWALTLYLLASLVIMPLGATIVGLFYGYGLEEVFQVLSGSSLESASERAIFRWLQAINQLATWGLVGLFLLITVGDFQKVMNPSASRQPLFLSMIILAVVCMMVSIPLVQLITFDAESFSLPAAFQTLEESLESSEALAEELLKKIITGKGFLILAINILVFAVIPAVCEELFFRGFLQHTFQRIMSPHIAIILTAFIFSIIHFQVFGLFSRFFLGILLGYFTYYSGSLIPSIIAHFSYNAVSIIVVYYQYLEPQGEEIGSSIPLYLGIISFLATISCLFFYFRLSSQGKIDSSDT